MGSLILPHTGVVYVDTSPVIYTVEHHVTFEPPLRALWAAAQSRTIEVLTSELTLMECLVGPIRAGNTLTQSQFESALTGPDVQLAPIDRAVLREAARLRATIPALRTPDAIHAATALLNGCALFLTNDSGFRRVPGLSVAVLHELI